MSSFLNSSESKRLEIGDAEICGKSQSLTYSGKIYQPSASSLHPSLTFPAVITVGMFMRGKTDLVYPKRLKSTKELST